MRPVVNRVAPLPARDDHQQDELVHDRRRQRPQVGADVLARIEGVYSLYLAGYSVRDIAEKLDLSRPDVHALIKRGRAVSSKQAQRSADELRADSLARLAMAQKHALDSFIRDRSSNWIAEFRHLERLRVAIEGTASSNETTQMVSRVKLFEANILLPRKDMSNE